MNNIATVKHTKTNAPDSRGIAGQDALNASPAMFKRAALEMGYGQGFANAMEEMARCEGTGRAKNEGDGAGITFCGLTTRDNLHGYNAQRCNAMKINEVLKIYHDKYWSNIGLDKFQGVAPAVAFRCFDAHVNSGAGGMSHMLSWVCDRLHIPSSGGRSSDKMQAISDAIKDGKISEDAVHKECANARVWWYRERCSSKWTKFGRGWMNRLKHVAERVGIIRGQAPDDSFDYSVTSASNSQPAGSVFFSLFGRVQGAFQMLLGFMHTDPLKTDPLKTDPLKTEPLKTGAKSDLQCSEEDGSKYGDADSKYFTKFFGEPKETYNSKGKAESKKDSMGAKPLAPIKEFLPLNEPKTGGLEASLARISQDMRSAEAKKKSEERGSKNRQA